jgi:vancomycin resistance protein YoaR
MATLTEQPDVLAAPAARRLPEPRFFLAFGFGVLAVLAIAAGALLAFVGSYDGRILPGVHVGSTDLGGLGRDDARRKLLASFAELGDGTLVLTADGKTTTASYSSIRRRLDVDGMLEQAMAAGRSGTPAERLAQDVRYALFGYTVEPAATFDQDRLEGAVARFATQVDVAATDASVVVGDASFTLTASATGRAVDRVATAAAAAAAISSIDAPSRVTIDAPVADTQPAVGDEAASDARQAAVRIARDLALVAGEDDWTIPAAQIRGWLSFARGQDGSYGPVVAREAVESALTGIAAKVEKKAVDATFLLGRNDTVVGVTEAKDGRTLDVAATVAGVEALIHDRAMGVRVDQLALTTQVVRPKLTTEDAQKTAPLMEPVSQWTTYFPWGINNGYGANIWIPARDLDGMVVMPGQKFDFWRSIGPVTRARGYKDGGAIINGKTEPQGALAGGICSASTTLFNAALRAGLEMGARRNHYYYIDRYPKGLDATVYQSSSGAVQTMSWTNDTKYPILIRSYGWREGVRGYVKFVLWSVPIERTVAFSDPIVKNVRHAIDTVVYTTTLKPGVKKRTEAVHDGMDVWVTRTVRDAAGTVIHKETYYSHYGRVNGVVMVGVAPTVTPTPTGTPPPPTP